MPHGEHLHPDLAPLVQPGPGRDEVMPLREVPYGERAENPFVSEPPKPRHAATVGLLRFFEFEHLPPHLRTTSRECHMLAHAMVDRLPDGPELTSGLRKLLEAKDCFVRAALDA
jgi:hypothetical protein